MLLKLSKIFIAMLFLNLYVIYTLTGSYIPNGTLIFGVLAGVCMVADVIIQNSTAFSKIGTEMITLIAFMVFAFITAPFALNMSTAINASFEFFQKLVMVFVVYYICYRDGSLKFPVRIFLCIALICAVYVIGLGGDLSDRVALSDNVKENTLGNIMVLGTFCALYLYKGKYWYSLSVLAGCLAVFVLVIALSGSRKSILAICILLVAYLILIPKDTKFSVKSIVSFVVFIVIAIVLIYYLYPMLIQTSLYDRLFDETVSQHANTSNQGRKLLYEYAWYDFRKNPFLGLGMRNFSYKHGSYTHSAYAEVLACTGIIGTVLYFVSYILTFKKLWFVFNDKSIEGKERRNAILIFVFYLVFLYIGIGIGHLYDNISMVELSMFMAYASLMYVDPKREERSLKKDG